MNHSIPDTSTAVRTCAFAVLMAVPCLAQEPTSEAEQLAAARKAVLGEQTAPANLIATGTAKFFGLEGPLTIWLGEDGKFRSRVDSKVGEQFCWDGSSGFKVDLTGMPSSFGLFELDRFRLLFAAVGGGWAVPGSGIDSKFEVGLQGSQPPQIAVHTKHSNLDGRITLHPDTHRPDTLDFAGHRPIDPKRDEYWTFDDFVNVDECWLPRSIVCTRDGLVITRFTIESWRNFFRRAVLDLDLSAHTLALHPRSYKRDTDWLPIAFHAFTPYVEGELFGRFRGHFLLDLGDPNHAVLSKRFVAANGLAKAGALSGPTRSSRPSRRYELRRAKTFRVGNRQDGNLPVLLAKQHQHAYESSRLAGRLGLGYLRNARLWLDYGRGRMAIE